MACIEKALVKESQSCKVVRKKEDVNYFFFSIRKKKVWYVGGTTCVEKVIC